MVPKYDKLIEFSGMLAELLRDTTEIEPGEISVHFKAPADVIARLNEDFGYRTGQGDPAGVRSVDEIDVRVNGMDFVYENNGMDTGGILPEMEESDGKIVDGPVDSGHKSGILGWFRRRKNKPAES